MSIFDSVSGKIQSVLNRLTQPRADNLDAIAESRMAILDSIQTIIETRLSSVVSSRQGGTFAGSCDTVGTGEDKFFVDVTMSPTVDIAKSIVLVQGIYWIAETGSLPRTDATARLIASGALLRLTVQERIEAPRILKLKYIVMEFN